MEYLDQNILLNHLKKGEKGAYVFLVETYSKRLYGYAVTLTKNEEMAQDIIQNVFLKVWEKRNNINITTSLQNYLFKLVYNEFINLYNKKRSRMLLEQKYFESLERTVTGYDENVLKKVLEKIAIEIQNLPPKCGEVFLMSRKDGLTNIEIADYLNVSTKTVEAHIAKAFKILKKNLKGKFSNILFALFGKPKIFRP